MDLEAPLLKGYASQLAERQGNGLVARIPSGRREC